MSSEEPSIHLYTTQTPNGIKISITLEELGLPYQVTKLDISTNVQKEPWFLAINPNGRIPALTDTFSDGQQINLWESGSVMQYLVATYDKDYKISYPPGTREYYETNNWLFFQNAGLGPMQGQANHFTRYAPTKIEYGMKRYQNETRRLYSILETQLSKPNHPYIVGDKLTIADIASWGWVYSAGWAGVDINEFPKLQEWEQRVLKRPAVEKGRHVPDPHRIKEVMQDKEKMKQIEEHSRAWVQEGMKKDAQK